MSVDDTGYRKKKKKKKKKNQKLSFNNYKTGDFG